MASPLDTVALTIAQQGRSQASFWLWLFVLIVVTVLAGIAIVVIRRRLLESDATESSPGTLMEDLRRMRDRGEITEEEYDRTRKAIAARAAGREPPPIPPPDPDAPRRARPGYDLTGDPLPGSGPIPGPPETGPSDDSD